MNIFTRLSLIGLTTFCFVMAVPAATFVVNTTDDTADTALGNGACADSNSNCSLRAAISEANALAGADIITLGAAAYTQTLVANEENQNAGGDWDITSDITINGVSQASTILQAPGCAISHFERVLDVSGTTVTLNDLTVRNGCASTVAPFPGGGIFNTGNLTLNNVTVRDNKVQNFEGGASGGGIFHWGGSLTLNNSTVTNNTVSGAMFGGSAGGGIYSQSSSPIVINNSSISGNQAGGINQLSFGGGMYAVHMPELTITNSHFDNNTVSGTAGSSGGGLYVFSDAASIASVNITGSTFNSNTSPGANANGIGLYLLMGVDQARFNVKLDQSTINGNSGSGTGAGMQVRPSSGSIRLDVTNTTISNNTSSGSTGGGVDMSTVGSNPGAEIYAVFTNTTVSGNSATEGGAVAARVQAGSVTAIFDYCTLANNTASTRGGGIGESGGAFLYLQRSVVAGNTAPNGPDISVPSSIASLDYNHIGNPAGMVMHGGTAHNTTGNALLGALANNGGPTLTHMPDAGSPVVDGIPSGQGGCGSGVFNDQRGFGRPFGTGCDKGSVERGATLSAGPWTLSGTVKTTTGIPIRNVAVTISGGNLPAPVTVFTGNFGTYQFTNLSGSDYTVTVTAKRYHFNDSIVVFSVGSNITNADFIANAPFEREALEVGTTSVKSKSLK